MEGFGYTDINTRVVVFARIARAASKHGRRRVSPLHDARDDEGTVQAHISCNATEGDIDWSDCDTRGKREWARMHAGPIPVRLLLNSIQGCDTSET
ncbi:hypothetical protein JCM10599A_54280 [Paraburkholderia kururiensis]